jgi:hypothetical protein
MSICSLPRIVAGRGAEYYLKGLALRRRVLDEVTSSVRYRAPTRLLVGVGEARRSAAPGLFRPTV